MGWDFAVTNDKTNSGANVQAFETFDEDGSIIREIIQNSLDAKREECSNVIVEIEISSKNTSDFPAKEELLKSLQACYERFNGVDTKSTGKLQDMIESFEDDQHYFVSFRDLNTNGLLGGLSDGDEKTNLYQLVYGDGTTNKNTEKSSGGSFGIGKNAPFTRSKIKSIFYETYNVDEQKHIVGKSILTTHKIDGQTRSQRGYYIDDYQIEQYISDSGMKGEYGTAVHIPFYMLKNGSIKEEFEVLIRDVLLNFMVAIDRNKLEVRFINNDNSMKTIVNKETYSEITTNLIKNGKSDKHKRIEKIKALHNLLTNSNVNIYDLVIDNKDQENYIELYVALNAASTGFKKYFNFREQLMLIEDKKISGKNFKYDALAIYHGTKLNNILRDTEPPEHNNWRQNRLKTPADKKYFKLAKDTVENKLIELFGDVTSEQIVLKEFNNNIFSEKKEKDEVFMIKKISDRPKPRSKGQSEEIQNAAIYGTERKVKDKSKKKDKAQLNATGESETSVITYHNVTKKIRNKGTGLYKIQLAEYFDPELYKVKVFGKTDTGGEEDINNYDIVNNDGINVELQVNDVELDISVAVEERNEVKE